MISPFVSMRSALAYERQTLQVEAAQVALPGRMPDIAGLGKPACGVYSAGRTI